MRITLRVRFRLGADATARNNGDETNLNTFNIKASGMETQKPKEPKAQATHKMQHGVQQKQHFQWHAEHAKTRNCLKVPQQKRKHI